MLQAKNFLNYLKVNLWQPFDLSDIKPGFVIFSLNMEQAALAYSDLAFRKTFNSADIVLPDGISTVWTDLVFSHPPHLQKITGIDLAEKLLQKHRNIAIIGAHLEQILSIQKKFAGKIIYSHQGFFDLPKQKEIISQLKILEPELIIIGMGSPKQELLAIEIQKEISKSIIIVVGGAIDIWSKKLQRAPFFVRNLNLEWLFRIIQEPSRIFRFLGTVHGYVSLLCKFYTKRS